MIRCFLVGAFESFPDRIHDLVRLLTTTPCRLPTHDLFVQSHAWCVSAVAARGGATRIAQAIDEGDIGWWARDGKEVDWALCCLARNLAAEVAVGHHVEAQGAEGEEAEGEEDLMSRIMTPRAWNEEVFEAMAGALSQVMGVNILIVSRSSIVPGSEKTPYSYFLVDSMLGCQGQHRGVPNTCIVLRQPLLLVAAIRGKGFS
jgi:hypothetical protein